MTGIPSVLAVFGPESPLNPRQVALHNSVFFRPNGGNPIPRQQPIPEIERQPWSSKFFDFDSDKRWYNHPLWIMDHLRSFLMCVDALHGIFSVFKPPFNGSVLNDGAKEWDEVVQHLQAAQADSSQWSGPAADEFNAQVKAFQDQGDLLGGVDKQFHKSIKIHAGLIFGLHITMAAALAFITTVTETMRHQYKREKKAFRIYGREVLHLIDPALETYALFMAYKYIVLEQKNS